MRQVRQWVEARAADHMPAPWKDEAEYDAFCRSVNPLGDYSEHNSPWKEIRIRSGLTAEQVYRLLPWDLKHECAGYLTRTRIRYRRGGKVRAYAPSSNPCTFHSHPSGVWATSLADPPSASDLRTFVLSRTWRTITVGRFLLWVCDKTEAIIEVIRQLAAWEKAHPLNEVRRLEQEQPANWQHTYVTLALRKVGLTIPEDNQLWAKVWPSKFRDQLGLKVTIFKRD